jgi:hypothetical protein
MLCAAALAGCQHSNPPANLNLSLSRPTDQGRYVIEIEPPAEPLRVNRMHAWRVAVRTAAGEPVQHATIAVSGGMPQHGHGLPTQPRVSPLPEAGRYVLEGMKFSMTGWWEIKLDVRSPQGEDRVTFNTVLPASAS